MNTAQFLVEPQKYLADGYAQFCAFGGPCVHFHVECLRAGAESFLSERHIEMLYATLTAWGMHRLGDSSVTKTKLPDWQTFRASIAATRDVLLPLRDLRMLDMTEKEYGEALSRLRPCYTTLKLSSSRATIVVNSKALFHLVPHLIPPIDRQYTIRFFNRQPADWFDAKGKFRLVMLPSKPEVQFELFRSTCLKIKNLADQIDRSLLDEEWTARGVTAPKAMDNAIVSYVRATAAQRLAV